MVCQNDHVEHCKCIFDPKATSVRTGVPVTGITFAVECCVKSPIDDIRCAINILKLISCGNQHCSCNRHISRLKELINNG